MLRTRLDECVQPENPLAAPDYLEADVQALRACQGGHASEDQQKRAIKYIIEKICGTDDCACRPGPADRETNLALGKQRAGQILVYLLKDAPTETPVAKIAARFVGRSKNND